MNPILSICIPTYNRCAALKASLEAMTSDPAFLNHDDIEIVISDNASPDDTEKVCRVFAERFPKKILYHRQPVNKGFSANLETLTELACGEYIKFINDKFSFHCGAMEDVYALVKEHLKDKLLLFWGGNADGIKGPVGVISCRTGDQFIETVSHSTTWLGAYGFWRSDIQVVNAIWQTYADTLIPQVAVVLKLFARYKRAMVYHKPMVCESSGVPKNEGGYNVAEVFGKNYLSILRTFSSEIGLSKKGYAHEKKKVFLNLIFTWYFDFNNKRPLFKRKKYFSLTKDYHLELYYWFSFAAWPIFKLISFLPKRVKSIPLQWYSAIRKTFN